MNKRDCKGMIVKVEHTMNGFVFKDDEAFKNKLDEPCYIPESAFGDFMYCDDEGINHYAVDDYTSIYTYQDFIEAVKNRFKDVKMSKEEAHEIAQTIFEDVDWQSPESLLDELSFGYDDEEE